MSILDRLFKKNKSPTDKTIQRVDVMSGSPAIFTPFSGNAYQNDLYRSAVDAIAKNFAKLVPTHVITQAGQRKDGDSKLNYILQTRPNPYMSSYDFLYKMATHYFLYNNSFAYMQLDDRGNLQGIYPISPLSVDFVTDTTGTLYCKFLFSKGKTFIVEYSQVILLRRFYNNNDLLGDTNGAILPALNLAHTQNQGMENSIKSTATLRGILKYNQALSGAKLKEAKEEFIKDYLSMENDGGICAVDTKMDYQPIDNKPTSINGEQLEAVKSKIYNYLGVSEKIINCTYTDDEWSSFYESTIEPLSTQLSLELTEKLFTQREQSFGNSILLEANRLQFASTKTKNELIFNLLPMGLISINEARKILNMPSIEGGDKYLQSLNYVNKDVIDQYQMGGKKNEGNTNLGDTN